MYRAIMKSLITVSSKIRVFASSALGLCMLCIGLHSINTHAANEATKTVEPEQIINVYQQVVKMFLAKPDLNQQEINSAISQLKSKASTMDQMYFYMLANNPNINPDWLSMEISEAEKVPNNKAVLLLQADQAVTTIKILAQVYQAKDQSEIAKTKESCAKLELNLKHEDQAANVDALKIYKILCH